MLRLAGCLINMALLAYFVSQLNNLVKFVSNGLAGASSSAVFRPKCLMKNLATRFLFKNSRMSGTEADLTKVNKSSKRTTWTLYTLQQWRYWIGSQLKTTSTHITFKWIQKQERTQISHKNISCDRIVHCFANCFPFASKWTTYFYLQKFFSLKTLFDSSFIHCHLP